MKLEFCRQIFEKYSYKMAKKSVQVAAELFHVDWETDMTKLVVDFRNFANATKNWIPSSHSDSQKYPPFTEIIMFIRKQLRFTMRITWCGEIKSIYR